MSKIGIAGNRRRARIVRRAFNEMLFAPVALPGTAILTDDDDPIGLIKLGEEAGGDFSIGLAWMALRIFGPIGIFGLLRRVRSR